MVRRGEPRSRAAHLLREGSGRQPDDAAVGPGRASRGGRGFIEGPQSSISAGVGPACQVISSSCRAGPPSGRQGRHRALRAPKLAPESAWPDRHQCHHLLQGQALYSPSVYPPGQLESEPVAATLPAATWPDPTGFPALPGPGGGRTGSCGRLHGAVTWTCDPEAGATTSCAVHPTAADGRS